MTKTLTKSCVLTVFFFLSFFRIVLICHRHFKNMNKRIIGAQVVKHSHLSCLKTFCYNGKLLNDWELHKQIHNCTIVHLDYIAIYSFILTFLFVATQIMHVSHLQCYKPAFPSCNTRGRSGEHYFSLWDNSFHWLHYIFKHSLLFNSYTTPLFTMVKTKYLII